MNGADGFPSATGSPSFRLGEYGNPQKTPFTTQVLPNRWWSRKRGSFAAQSVLWLQKRLELFFVANSPKKLLYKVPHNTGRVVTELNSTVRYSTAQLLYFTIVVKHSFTRQRNKTQKRRKKGFSRRSLRCLLFCSASGLTALPLLQKRFWSVVRVAIIAVFLQKTALVAEGWPLWATGIGGRCFSGGLRATVVAVKPWRAD